MATPATAPSIDLWRSLYEAADTFFYETPWKFLDNEAIFGVEDPVSKQIGWCSIMGDAGIRYGLSVMRGPRGFKALMAMLDEIDPEELLPYLDSLNMTFMHSDFLESRDLAVIKELGIGSRYKGTQKWPIFRAYYPARYPWYLTSGEAVFLKDAMEQALEVVRLANKDRGILAKGSPDSFLVRVSARIAGATGWRNEYRAAEPYVEPRRTDCVIDPETARKIMELPVREEVSIEADLFITSTPILDSEPPWVPWLMLAVDVASDFVFKPECIPKESDPIVEGSRQLIAILDGLSHRPAKVTVKNDVWYRYLEKPFAGIGIRLEKATTLPALKKVKESMKDYMRWDRSILEG